MLYVSHDLLSVASLCHRIAILHEGTIVEVGKPQDIFENPQHEYTRRLVNAVPTLRFKQQNLIEQSEPIVKQMSPA